MHRVGGRVQRMGVCACAGVGGQSGALVGKRPTRPPRSRTHPPHAHMHAPTHPAHLLCKALLLPPLHHHHCSWLQAWQQLRREVRDVHPVGAGAAVNVVVHVDDGAQVAGGEAVPDRGPPPLRPAVRPVDRAPRPAALIPAVLHIQLVLRQYVGGWVGWRVG